MAATPRILHPSEFWTLLPDDMYAHAACAVSDAIFGGGREWSKRRVHRAAVQVAARFASLEAFDAWYAELTEYKAAAFFGEKPKKGSDKQGYGVYTSAKYMNLLGAARKVAYMTPDLELIAKLNATWADGMRPTPSMYAAVLLGATSRVNLEQAAEDSCQNSKHTRRHNLEIVHTVLHG